MALSESDDDVVLLHNPGCSKSRATKALLEERGVALRERAYLEAPLDAAELADLATRLGSSPAAWTRRGEPAYAEAGLGPDSDDAAHLAALVAHPILMERPIVVRGSRARIGRPPERVLELFEE